MRTRGCGGSFPEELSGEQNVALRTVSFTRARPQRRASPFTQRKALSETGGGRLLVCRRCVAGSVPAGPVR